MQKETEKKEKRMRHREKETKKINRNCIKVGINITTKNMNK